MPRIAAPIVATAALGVCASYAFARGVAEGAEPALFGQAELPLDRVGAAVLLGGVIGACIGLLSHGLVRAALRVDTQAAFQALVIGFGAKAAGAVLPWATLAYLPAAQGLADGGTYLIAYAAVVLVVLGAGIFDNLHLSNEIALDAMERGAAERPSASDRGGRASSGSPQPSGSSDALESVS